MASTLVTPNTVLAQVDKDYDPMEGMDRVGTQWTINSVLDWWGYDTSPVELWGHAFSLDGILLKEHTVRWRVKDSDDNIYYGGWLINDGECIVQQAILKWAERDVGATTIEVRDVDTNEWKAEIG